MRKRSRAQCLRAVPGPSTGLVPVALRRSSSSLRAFMIPHAPGNVISEYRRQEAKLTDERTFLLPRQFPPASPRLHKSPLRCLGTLQEQLIVPVSIYPNKRHTKPPPARVSPPIPAPLERR